MNKGNRFFRLLIEERPISLLIIIILIIIVIGILNPETFLTLNNF